MISLLIGLIMKNIRASRSLNTITQILATEIVSTYLTNGFYILIIISRFLKSPNSGTVFIFFKFLIFSSKRVHQIRSYGRNIGINFWFNYEKIFEKGPFADKCNSKKLDSSLSLDKLIYKSSKEDYFLSFK